MDGQLVVDEKTGEVLPAVVGDTFLQVRPPAETLAQAHEAARLLMQIIRQKPKPVRFNGETYLEFEDWQTIGAMFGVTVGVERVEPCDLGGVQGFVAYAIARRADGQVVSSADALCMRDEPNWKTRPLYAVRSMAQTRACAKALRNVFAWVAVLAGYKPTPAEEMPFQASAVSTAPSGGAEFVESAGSMTNFACQTSKRDGTPLKSPRYVWEMGDGRRYSTFDGEIGERVNDAWVAKAAIVCRGAAEAKFGAHEALSASELDDAKA